MYHTNIRATESLPVLPSIATQSRYSLLRVLFPFFSAAAAAAPREQEEEKEEEEEETLPWRCVVLRTAAVALRAAGAEGVGCTEAAAAAAAAA